MSAMGELKKAWVGINIYLARTKIAAVHLSSYLGTLDSTDAL